MSVASGVFSGTYPGIYKDIAICRTLCCLCTITFSLYDLYHALLPSNLICHQLSHRECLYVPSCRRSCGAVCQSVVYNDGFG